LHPIRRRTQPLRAAAVQPSVKPTRATARRLHERRDMTTHPVTIHVATTPERGRIHVLIRLVLLAGLGAIGCSSIYWLLYLFIPAVAALLIAQKSGARYLSDDAPRIARALSWLAAAYAYLWLLTDQWPTDEAHPVELVIAPEGEPNAGTALARLVYSIPALLLLTLASIVAGLLWLAGMLAILVSRRVPDFVTDYLTLVLAYRFRLVAYHFSLVHAYPSFAEPLVPHTA
jgi:hypothetical protein